MRMIIKQININNLVIVFLFCLLTSCSVKKHRAEVENKADFWYSVGQFEYDSVLYINDYDSLYCDGRRIESVLIKPIQIDSGYDFFPKMSDLEIQSRVKLDNNFKIERIFFDWIVLSKKNKTEKQIILNPYQKFVSLKKYILINKIETYLKEHFDSKIKYRRNKYNNQFDFNSYINLKVILNNN